MTAVPATATWPSRVCLIAVLAIFPVTAQAAQDTVEREQASPAPNAAQKDAPYDQAREETFSGTVAEIKSGGPGRLGWLMRVHTLGLGHGGTAETAVLLDTDQGAVRVHLGPTTFVKQKRIEIEKGDRIEVIGSRVAGDDEPSRILAREVRKANNAWTLRDPAGRPVWSAADTPPKRFWTRNKVIVIGVVAAKVVLLTTVLRH